jgi:hypothetical protein
LLIGKGACPFAHRSRRESLLLWRRCSSSVQRGEIRHQTKRADRNALIAKQCDKARADDRAAVIAAQKAATERALAEKAAKEATYAQIKKDSENAYKPQLDAARARLAEWMRAHRADQGSTGRADLSAAPAQPGLPDGPNREPVLVETDDLNICLVNTVRLKAVQRWWADIQNTQKPAP